jgi:hypothetical protein
METSHRWLKTFFTLYSYVTFKVLAYLIEEINYDGYITDDGDRRNLLSIFADFLNIVIMKDDYLFAENLNYFSLPEQSHKMHLTVI